MDYLPADGLVHIEIQKLGAVVVLYVPVTHVTWMKPV